MARSPRWLRELMAKVQREVEREWQQREREEAWRRGNEQVRGRHRTPRAERPECGAKCRDGHPCQALPVWDRGKDRPRNGRCRMHGGLSTGARTEAGKARAQEAARRGGRASAEKRRRGRDDGVLAEHLTQ
jgi:hypothetical protein